MESVLGHHMRRDAGQRHRTQHLEVRGKISGGRRRRGDGFGLQIHGHHQREQWVRDGLERHAWEGEQTRTRVRILMVECEAALPGEAGRQERGEAVAGTEVRVTLKLWCERFQPIRTRLVLLCEHSEVCTCPGDCTLQGSIQGGTQVGGDTGTQPHQGGHTQAWGEQCV